MNTRPEHHNLPDEYGEDINLLLELQIIAAGYLVFASCVISVFLVSAYFVHFVKPIG